MGRAKQPESSEKKPVADEGLIGQAQETAWDAIGQAAVGRVGRGRQLKGVIHEIALKTRKNLNPRALVMGKRAALNGSANARGADLVITHRHKVVEGIQVKDVISPSGQRDLHRRVASGQYKDVKLVGTPETAQRYNASAQSVGQPMESSGISSASTTRAADNAGAKAPNKHILSNNFKDIARSARTAAVMGTVLGVGMEAYQNYDDYKSGEIDGGTYARKVTVGGVKTGAATSARTAAALGLKEGAKEAAKHLGSEGLKRLAGSNAATGVAFGLVEQSVDTVRLCRGDINAREYGARTFQTTGTTSGALGGAALGAAAGSVVPGLGNVIGAVVGGVLGAVGGSVGGRRLGDLIFKNKDEG